MAQVCGLMIHCQHTMVPTLLEDLLVILSHLSNHCTCLPSGTSTWRTACTCDAGRSSCATAHGASSSGSMWGTTWCLAILQVSFVKGPYLTCCSSEAALDAPVHQVKGTTSLALREGFTELPQP